MNVALTIFNRPEETKRVFLEIRQARPEKLFLIADAGRNPEEQSLCEATRMEVEQLIDWPVTVFKNYADINMGAKMRLATGITWVFKQVDRAIILEHDCLPNQDFFRFCDELLERYKYDKRVMHIGGNDFQQYNPNFSPATSYYFVTIPHIWGFATWARAWKYYDVNVSNWPEIRKSGDLEKIFIDPAVRDRWEYVFTRYYNKEVESWDAQWALACITHGVSINPSVNLVTNIGFGPAALSTRDPNHKFANIPLVQMRFPIVHPKEIIVDSAADAYTALWCFDINRRIRDKIRWFVKYNFPQVYRIIKKFFGRK